MACLLRPEDLNLARLAGPCESTSKVRFSPNQDRPDVIRIVQTSGIPRFTQSNIVFPNPTSCHAHTITTATGTATMTTLTSTLTKVLLTSSTRPSPSEPSPPSTPLQAHTLATSSNPGLLACSTRLKTHLNTSKATPMTSSFYASPLKVASSSSRFFSRLVQAI